ncbi:MAG: glycosyltransferase family 39 protein [Actinomycetota bacterium]|nr:glycosyltransferase family 39 protein [Actinomycetota bacterium]
MKRLGATASALRDPFALALLGVLALALGLRLWGIRYGLPVAYSIDERSHFVPRAVAYFSSGSLDPQYQLNPSGLIEWIAASLAVVYRSRQRVVDTWQTDPGEIWTIARIASALLSTAAVALIYAAGARLYDRKVGLLAAALLATCFLPVHYGHFALNDAPSLAPTALALFAIAGVLRFGRARDYALAGIAIGFAVGMKYNAVYLLAPLLTAATLRATGRFDSLGARGGERRIGPALTGLALAGVGTAAGFLISDPYAILDLARFRHDVAHLSDYTTGGLLLGETQRNGHLYYLWSIGWGFGFVPAALAVAGGVVLLVRDRVSALLLIPAALIFFAYIGAQGRYFARYVMPLFPIFSLLAAVGAIWLASWLAARVKLAGRRAALLAIAVGALACAQGVIYAVHNDVVLSREDTRTATRAWMVAHIPAGTRILVEPLVPQEWYRDGGLPVSDRTQRGFRWTRFIRTRSDIERLAERHPLSRRNADFHNYPYTLFPGLFDYYRRRGVCWLVSGSGQTGRAFNNPRRVPEAIAYYTRLPREAQLRFQSSPFGEPGDGPEHPFHWDKSHNYYSLAYERPGVVMRVYQLRRCAPGQGPIQRPR